MANVTAGRERRGEGARPSLLAPPQVALPKGGGAIRGIGEKFGVNLVTGTGSMRIPLAVSAGRGGRSPDLSLSYDSGAGSGPFGLGWSLGLPQISRRTDRGLPTYRDDEDVFVLSGAEDLVPALERTAAGKWVRPPVRTRIVNDKSYAVRRYVPRAEGAFSRIERWTSMTDPADVFWRVISAENVTTWYGRTPESRISDPAEPSRVFTWLICQSHDDTGNVTVYTYKDEDSSGVEAGDPCERHRSPKGRRANRYLKRVRYGNHAPYLPLLDEHAPWPEPGEDWHFEVVFDYGEHSEDAPAPSDTGTWDRLAQPFSSYRAGFEVRTYRRCHRVLMFHHFEDEPDVGLDCLVRSTTFEYLDEPQSVLRAVTQRGHRRSGDGYQSRALPPVEFEYSTAAIDETVREVDPANLPQGVDGGRYQWADLDGDGLSGVLTEQGDAWFYRPNLSGGRFGPPRPVSPLPSQRGLAAPGGDGRYRLLDLSGGGRLDVAVFDSPAPGFYQRDAELPGAEGWRPFVPFARLPVVAWDDPDLRFADLTGDGRADVVVTGDEVLTWYRSLGEDGFGAPETVRRAADEDSGPRLVFADGTQSVYLADMSGDGLTDLVRLRNGDICYWPALGYGRFGAKVSMAASPWLDAPDRFDHSRVRLADIDGTGPTDLIYLGPDRVDIYSNRNGNGWSEARSLSWYPHIDDVTTVSTVDLLGTGTACLVWSSPLPGATGRPMRYIDLMGGVKPHLMVACENNLGTRTEVEYAPSTRFALADRAAGRPWLTRLPFPVYVVVKASVHDQWRDTTFASSYSYHHGYFDPVEREFRGFGRVEQVDVESYGAFLEANVDSPYVSDHTLFQPPVKTISWQHTGFFAGRNRILGHLSAEYFHPAAEHDLGEPDLDGADLSGQEWREALRACRGRPLRTEVYELDVDALHQRGEHVPVRLYSTTQRRCQIRLIQPAAGNPHAVFQTLDGQSIAYDYDLDLRPAGPDADPRVTHSLVLAVDTYGRPTMTAAAVYPRQGEHDEPAFTPSQHAMARALQREPHLSRIVTHYTDELPSTAGPDVHRLPLPCQVVHEELSGISPADGYFTPDEIRNTPQGRVTAHSRTLYLSDDLQGPLALGALGIRGIEAESFRLAFDLTGLTEVFGALLDVPALGARTARDLLDDPAVSGYLLQNGQYWTRSGTAVYAADALQHFLLPEAHLDPFGARTSVSYDPYDLFPESTVDALGNAMAVDEFDYRVLAARVLRDANDNLSEVRFDVLGRVAATATRGKGTEADDLSALTPDLVDLPAAAIEAFCTATTLDTATARTWLAGATTRFAYHLGEVCDATGAVVGWNARPVGACAIARERHGDPNTPLHVSLQFSDGSGGILMTKQQAEPEPGSAALRWIVSGKVVVNNKGKAVKQYEPYFSADFGLEEPLAAGVTPLLYYDAAGRLIRTELPDGTVHRVEFSPWHVTTFDANDTVADAGNAWYAANSASPDAERRRAAALCFDHAGTPSTTLLDSLGRDVVTIARTGTALQVSVKRLDPDGKLLWLRDARGNLVTQHLRPAAPPGQAADPTGYTTGYDLAGNPQYESTMDAGERWSLLDAAGQPLVAWTSNQRQDDDGTVVPEDRVAVLEYDALRRQVGSWLSVNSGPSQLVELTVYGEPLADAKDRNLRGQAYQRYESSGLLQVDRMDFAGRQTDARRRLVRDFAAPVIDWQGDPEPKLETETFFKRAEYDASGRIVRDYNWHRGIGSRVAVIEPSYDARGSLASVSVVVRANRTQTGYAADPAYPARTLIEEIRYNARGQREMVRRGNGTLTTFDHDPMRFRLAQVRTTRPGSNPLVLQQLSYTYDANGNLVAIRDDAYEPVFFQNQQVEPVSRYTYDALYRLVVATGRESHVATVAPWQIEAAPAGAQFPLTAQTLRNYTEEFDYDAVGNLLEARHIAGSQGSWTRHHEYATDRNRLLKTWQGNNIAGATNYRYDERGNMLNLANVAPEQHLRWDHRDLIRAIDLQGGGWAYYTYAGDRRVRQLVTRAGTLDRRWERIDLGGLDVYRRYSAAGAVVEEIESHHVMAGDELLLLIDDVLSTDNANLPTGPLYRFQYGNHQGSTTLELDEQTRIISYEEFHPYGTSAYRATDTTVEAPPSRYRYTGVVRDEESGLDYRGARYYAPWLGRWLSCDPAGTGDGPNRYEYGHSSPLANADRNGQENDSTPATPAPVASGNPFGDAGTYIELLTKAGWTREHLLPGKQMYWLLVQQFGKAEVDRVYGRLYRNAWAVQSPNSISFPKTHGETTLNDNEYTGLMRADAQAGTVTDARMWFLNNMRNIEEAMRLSGIEPDEETKQYLRENASTEAGALFRMEVLLDEKAAGKPIPTQLADQLRPQPAPAPAAPKPVTVHMFEKKETGKAAQTKAATPPPAAPGPAAKPPAAQPPPANKPAPGASAPAPADNTAPSTPEPAGISLADVKSFGMKLGDALLPTVAPAVASLLAALPFDSPQAKLAAATLGSMLTAAGLQWGGMVGMGTLGTALSALMGSSGATIAGAGAGMIGAAGVLVAAAGALGVGIGMIANKLFMYRVTDWVGGGAVGDWWYEHVTKVK